MEVHLAVQGRRFWRWNRRRPCKGNLLTNGDLETGDDSGGYFQNGRSAALDNTTANAGTWSVKIATGGAINPGAKQERFGISTVNAGDVVQVQFDHKGAVGGEGGI